MSASRLNKRRLSMDELLPIGILHLDIRHGALAENRASLLAHAEEAAAGGARIIVAPELAISGYGFDGREEVAPYVEEITGETLTSLSQVCPAFRRLLLRGVRGTGQDNRHLLQQCGSARPGRTAGSASSEACCRAPVVVPRPTVGRKSIRDAMGQGGRAHLRRHLLRASPPESGPS